MNLYELRILIRITECYHQSYTIKKLIYYYNCQETHVKANLKKSSKIPILIEIIRIKKIFERKNA